MKTIILPQRERWNELCKRPLIPASDLENIVREILNRVKSEGDRAVNYFSEKFDGVRSENLKVGTD